MKKKELGIISIGILLYAHLKIKNYSKIACFKK